MASFNAQSRRILLLVTCLALLGACLGGTTPTNLWLTGLLVVVPVMVEWAAVRLPDFGWLTFSFPCLLVVAFAPGVGLPAAAMAAGIVLAVRGVRSQSLAEVLFEAIPTSLALVASWLATRMGWAEGWLDLLIPACVYIGLVSLFHPSWLGLGAADQRWVEARSLMFPLQVGSVAAGCAGVMLVRQDPIYLLWLAPLPVVGTISAQIVLQTLAAREREGSSFTSEARVARELAESLDETREELQAKLEERTILEELARTLASSPELIPTLRAAANMVGRLVECRSIIFFANQGGELVPIFWRSPLGERIESSRLLALGEPVVSRAWERGRLVMTVKADLEQPRLMETEMMAAALPLRDLGVLYIGKTRPKPFTKRQLQLLALVADPLIPAIVAATRKTEIRKALEELGHSNELLERAVQQQSILLDGFQKLAATSSSIELAGSLKELLRNLVPHHSGAVLLWEGDELTAFEHWPLQAPGEELRRLAEDVRKTGKPMLVTRPTSQLALPLPSEHDVLGVFLLSSVDPDVFTSVHQELLQTVAIHASALLRNSRLFEQSSRANLQLKESQAQLVQSSKMAAVGQLAAGMAHEINSPLAAVLLALEMAGRANDKVKTAKVAEHLQVAEEAAMAAKEIIGNLLVYSRASKADQAPINLVEVAKRTALFVEPQLSRDGVTLVSRLEEVPLILGREADLQQIMTNLLLNARDASQQLENPRVELVTGHDDAYVWVEVRDWGPGIPDDIRDRIFEPFFTTKEIGRGTGLGLSVSLQMAEDLDGQLDYRRENDVTVFRLRLPIDPASS
ncbi:MAG: ATP-binding protein [Vulcanimicrobiota bacterium]